MPSKPRKNQSGAYFTTWSDSTRSPKQKVESLKTKKLGEARKRLNALDQLHRSGYHNPWEKSWFRNDQIKGFVESGVIDLQQLAKKKDVVQKVTAYAIQEYIDYKVNFAVWDIESARGYKSKLKGFLKYAPIYLNDLTLDHMRSYLSGKNEGYQIGLLQILNSFLNWAKDKNYIESVPKYPTPKKQKPIPTFIENDRFFKGCIEYLEKIEAETDPRAYDKLWVVCSWIVLRFTGMRPKEIRQLKPEHISLDYNRILVGGDFKTKTSRQRFVDIHDQALKLFELILSDAFRIKHPYTNGFLLGDGNEYCQEIVRKEFKKMFDTKLYHLKDTYGFWIITKGEQRDYNLIYLRDQFGHTTIKTTEIYLKVAPKEVPALHTFTYYTTFLEKMISYLSK
jgi:integrase